MFPSYRNIPTLKVKKFVLINEKRYKCKVQMGLWILFHS